MRKLLISAAAVAALALVGGAQARAEGLARFGSDCGCEPADCCECDLCNGGGHGRFGGKQGHGHHKNYEGRTAHFNCGCNGSYKFPVPPLYTYHWPGMWSQQLMTDYHSPWRFPAIKPYVDEPMPMEMGSDDYLPRDFRQAAFETGVASPTEPLSFSSRVRALTR